ncbi:MAG: sulfite exporter TauE/SafE family protein [Burkholderiales bacterium]
MPGLEALSPWGYAWVGAVLLGAGFVHGMLGLGFPLVAMPLLAMALPFKTAILFIMLPMLFVNAVIAFWGGGLRESIGRFWYMPIAPVAGAWTGTRLLIGAPPEPFLLLLALMLIVYLLRERLGRAEVPLVRRHATAFGVAAGMIGGFFEAVTNVSLPPMIIFLMMVGVSPVALVQVLNFSSLGTKAVQIGTWSVSGGVPLAFWAASLPWGIATVAALFAGARIRVRVDARTYMIWLRRFLWAMAALLMLQFLRATLS